MGMFDYLKCEYPLSAPEVQDEEFQTKRFSCRMDNYRIAEGGELFVIEHDYVEVPEQEREYYGKPEWERGGFYQLIGSMRSIPRPERLLINFSGEVEFYTYTGDINGDDDQIEWYEYVALYSKGELIKIDRITSRGA